ncbi:MAG: diguanylate cyclase [Rhodocyclaceae bacterium]
MSEFSTPAEIAREVIRQLATQRIPPTPENFADLYHKVGGTQPSELFPERQLRLIAAALPRTTPEQLRAAQRLDTAIAEQSWISLKTAVLKLSAEPAPLAPPVARAAVAPPLATPKSWRDLMAQVMETAVGMLLIDTPELATEATELAKIMRDPAAGDESRFEKRLRDFAYKLQWVAQDQSYIRQALLNLLQLIIENISELVIDDQWLQGQLDAVLQLFSKPLDKKMLGELGDKLRDVIYKQGTLKRSLSEAQERLRDLLAHFIDRLGELAESTGTYHTKMEAFSQRVTHARSPDDLAALIDEVLQETRVVEGAARRSQDELRNLRSTVDQAHREIARLETELQQASDLMRHDTLTGALNRKGIDEMLAREIARARRRQSELCVALLDVDNFKQLNDTYGHSTGDDALRHLADVVRETLRPQDSCGRYGGEEFLVLLPDTGADEAVVALTRLQRELTRRFFLHDNQRVLITFSAGVTQFIEGEDPQRTIDRADKAMYRAKRAGKNRVELG